MEYQLIRSNRKTAALQVKGDGSVLVRAPYTASHFVTVVQGGRKENQALLEQRFDFIFFTASVSVGKFVLEKASRYLTQVCLELGGGEPLYRRQNCQSEAGGCQDCI